MKSKKSVLIILPIAKQSVDREFFESYLLQKNYLIANAGKLPFELTGLFEFYCHTFPIDANRNESALRFMEGDYDISIWLDTDQDFKYQGQVDGLFRLLAYDAPVVAGMYYAKNFPFHPILFKSLNDDFTLFRPIAEYPQEPFHADMIGMGYVRIDKEVFEKCEMPYFKYQLHPENSSAKDSDWRSSKGINDVSEDVWFWKQVKDAGYKIVVDPSCKAGHITKSIIDESVYLETLSAEMRNIVKTEGKEKLDELLENLCRAEKIK